MADQPPRAKPLIRPKVALCADLLPETLLLEAIEATSDGVGIFGPDDRLLFCNGQLAQLFGTEPAAALNKHFNELILNAHSSGTGVNVEAEDIGDWLAMAQRKRRSSPYRSFQVDTQDGHWYQLTEQLTGDGHMVIWCTDITAQKKNEFQLRRLSEKLRYHAETDHLTGINNRRNFFRLAERELRRCRRSGSTVALLLMDVDHFKQVNDRFGHQVGDEVLCRIADELVRGLRDYDVLGRMGGEEFAALVPGMGQGRACQMAERLRKAVAGLSYSGEGVESLTTSLSIGLAIDADASSTLDTLISHADSALYKAKNDGRNCCCIWE